ncbi:MAG: hypothetical protein HDT39_00065 [Lachnospiraceae bacterium]|nr:hypothetical protein [Lachnospiraceae bacterium]
MNIESFRVIRLMDSSYKNEIQIVDEKVLYCEIKYKRDRSGFAGMAFKIINVNDVIVLRKCKEKIVQNVSKYEKLYRGCEQDYIDSIKEFFSAEKRKYGIEVFFLIYSDVCSSQIIFEELLKNVDKNLDIIKEKF